MDIWGSGLQFKALDEMYSYVNPGTHHLLSQPTAVALVFVFFTRSCPCPGIDPVPKQCPHSYLCLFFLQLPHMDAQSVCLWGGILGQEIPVPFYPH